VQCVCLVGVPFGRDDERPEDYESEIWETGMMVGSGFKVNGSGFRVQGCKHQKMKRR